MNGLRGDSIATSHRSQLPDELYEIVQRLTSAESSDRHLSLPRKSLAGVLVLLCRNNAGAVSVILTTRALTMRSFPGETALPGGKMEADDVDIAQTAIREAEEEIGLRLPKDDLTILCHMPPLLSKNLLYVVPVVAAYRCHTSEVLMNTLKPNAAEVGAIWAWPLRDFLCLPSETTQDATPRIKYAFQDVPWLLGHKYRLHHFHHANMASPVTGLTAEILLMIALIGYGVAQPGFQRDAENQLSMEAMLQAVLDGKAGLNGDTRSALRKARVVEDNVAGNAAM